MYFVVSKLSFEAESTPGDPKALAQLAEKLRQRFKISIQIADEFYKGGQAGIVVSAVHSHEMQLSELIDEIAEACEKSGFGRIDSESTILEDFEAYASETEG
jgi:2'-5' RNA ligase